MLAILVIVALALLTVSFRSPTSGVLHDAQGYGASVLRPFQTAAERVAAPFRDVYGYFHGLTTAKSQNEKLRKEVREWRAEALKNEAAAAQLPGLKKQLRYEEGPTLPAGLPRGERERDLVPRPVRSTSRSRSLRARTPASISTRRSSPPTGSSDASRTSGRARPS